MARTIHNFSADGLEDKGPGLHPTERHIVCPWRGPEFTVLTGEHVVKRAIRLNGLPVRVDGDDV